MTYTTFEWRVYQTNGTLVKGGFETKIQASHYARTKTTLKEWDITCVAIHHKISPLLTGVIEFKERNYPQ